MYKCIITSNNSNGREYEVKTKSAMVAAKELGRCEGNEIVTIYNKSGKAISQARWTPENGGEYYRAYISDND